MIVEFESRELIKYLLIATIMALLLIVRSRRKEKSLDFDQLEPIIHEELNREISPEKLRELINRVNEKGFKTRYSDETSGKLVIESKGIGLFHWGFLFFIMPDWQKQGTVTVGVYPKGPNPPTGNRLKNHLDQFVDELKQIL